MRRRIKHKLIRRGRIQAGKQIDYAWLTTSLLCVAGFIWYLLHLFSTLVFSCGSLIYEWWFWVPAGGPPLLAVSTLLVFALAAWFLAEMIRPKREAVPRIIRGLQSVLVFFLVFIAALQWGLYGDNRSDQRFYDYAMTEMAQWPVVSVFFISPDIRYETYSPIWEVPPQAVESDPLFYDYRVAVRAYDEAYATVHTPYARAYDRPNGKLACTARREFAALEYVAVRRYFERERLAAERAEQEEAR